MPHVIQMEHNVPFVGHIMVSESMTHFVFHALIALSVLTAILLPTTQPVITSPLMVSDSVIPVPQSTEIA